MTVSVIVPTYNGATKILNTLRALEQQTYQGFEVIVAIDGSTDDTFKLLQNSTFSFKSMKVIKQINKGRAAIRNFGAKEASGDLLTFYDDDIIAPENSLEEHLKFHKKYTNAILAGNPLEKEVWCNTDIHHYKRFLSLKWTNRYKYGLNKLGKDNLLFTAASCSIRKNNFNKCQGFDERLKDIEDYDFAIRAINLGLDVYFDKSNIVWHNDHITCRSYIQRRRQYKKAIEYLISLKPQYLSFMNKSDGVGFLKGAFLVLFSLKFWPHLIDNDDLTFVPKKIRYKIYEWVIFSLGEVYYNRKV